MTIPSAVQGLAWLGLTACLAANPLNAGAQTSFKLRLMPPFVDMQNYTVSTFANAISRNGTPAALTACATSTG